MRKAKHKLIDYQIFNQKSCQTQEDITIREQQYFDYFLKGAPMPVWMAKGVPAVDKGKDWGLELVKPL
ncbi:hypothetical protein [Mucilaginibacter ginsenosidivorax]|uniref:Uncharacterized protein n=1 Tax=Mucilaginibacter ginsenosidivorax TaxID=862126 RepID=A0A5B8WCG6_9SPHI|nr:hypothetical protein [Mucilaginibacter ginsenosidivorax]QEC80252.1 hypothetical protein FSB76_31435 [Mucilaginibacter ginsenosidivorax]